METDPLATGCAVVRNLLPAAIESQSAPGTVTFDSGGTRGIAVVVTADAFDIHLPTTEWHGHEPVVTTRRWRSIPHDQVDRQTLRRLLAEARQERRSEFRRCQFCGKSVPVEHRYDDQTCHGCSSTHFGVLY